MTNQEYAESLRLIATFFEEHPEIPPPHDAAYFRYFNFDTKDQAATLAHALGSCDKTGEDSFFKLTHRFGSINFVGFFNRDNICERMKVGTQLVQREVPIGGYKTETVEEDVFEWKCPEALLK